MFKIVSDHLKQIQVTRIKPIKHLPHFDDFNSPTWQLWHQRVRRPCQSVVSCCWWSWHDRWMHRVWGSSSVLLPICCTNWHTQAGSLRWLWHFGSTAPQQNKDSKSIQTRKGDWEHVLYSSHLVWCTVNSVWTTHGRWGERNVPIKVPGLWPSFSQHIPDHTCSRMV